MPQTPGAAFPLRCCTCRPRAAFQQRTRRDTTGLILINRPGTAGIEHNPEVLADPSCVRIGSQHRTPPGRTMVTPLEPVRAITLEEIENARERIARTIVRTPLLRLDTGRGGPEIRLKLENLQPTNSYKLRGEIGRAHV